jgi:hypothetical protein
VAADGKTVGAFQISTAPDYFEETPARRIGGSATS